jgi:hypothetical protein
VVSRFKNSIGISAMTVILLQAVDAAATARKPVIRDIEWRTLESQDFSATAVRTVRLQRPNTDVIV